MVVALALAVWPTLSYPLTRDQGAYAYIADLIRQGGVPYRDVWDLKPPAIYWMYSLSFSLLGRSELAVRGFDVLYTLATGAFVYLLAQEAFSDRRIAIGSAWLYAFGYHWFLHYYSLANPESFMAPYLLVAAWGLSRGLRCRDLRCMLVGGFAGGLAFWFKPTAGLTVLVLCCWLWVSAFRGSDAKISLGKATLALAVGAASALLVGVAALYGRGLSELVQLWRTYGSASYVGARGLALGDGPLAVAEVILGYVSDWQLLIWPTGAAVWSILRCWLRRQDGQSGRMTVVALLGATLGMVFVQGKYFEYHWIPVLAPASILTSFAVVTVWEECRSGVSRLSRPGMSCAFVIMTIAGLLALSASDRLADYRRTVAHARGVLSDEAYYAAFDIGKDFSHVGSIAAASYIRQHTSADDTVLIWGAEPLVNFLAARRSPTKYIFSYMLRCDQEDRRCEERRRDLMDEVQSKPPLYVALVDNDANPLSPAGSRSELTQFPSLSQWIDSDYRFENQVDDYLFLRRKA